MGDAQEEAAYFERACGQDQELRRRLEKLLHAGRKAKDFSKSIIRRRRFGATGTSLPKSSVSVRAQSAPPTSCG